MNSYFRVGIAAVCFMLPGVSLASTVTYEANGSQYTLLIDPHGSAPSELPKSYDYRSYNCRIGDKPGTPTVVLQKSSPVVTIPVINDPPAGDPPAGDPPAGNDPPADPPPVTDIIQTPPGAAVPLPAPASMAGVGLAVVAIFYWIRSLRQERA
jgi:hypothetical protein